MDILLIRHAETDPSRVLDPYTVPLTEAGRAQAEAIAARCAEWGIDFLCTSTMRSAQETADAVSHPLPEIERWDLEELEDMNIDDLLGQPMANPLVATWDEAQLQLGRERSWIRTVAAIARIQLYAANNDLERIAIIAHERILVMLLLNWLGLDWRSLSTLSLRMEPAATARVRLGASSGANEDVEVAWINRPIKEES